MDKLHVSLVTPEAELFSGEVDHVVAPGSECEFDDLAHHAPFMTTLAEGSVTIVNEGKSRVYQVSGGFADVNEDGMNSLAEQADEDIETGH